MYNARELAAMDKNQLWKIPDGSMKVVFDDGVLETTSRATIFSAYMWGIHVKWPKTPCTISHHLGDQKVGSDTHINLLGKVMWDCYDAYKGKVDIEELCKFVYQATNLIYNDFTYRLESYVRSLSVLDYIDVIHHPVIKAANESVKPTRQSIDKTKRIIREVLKDPKELRNNALGSAVRNGLIKIDQVLQCVGPRGYVTDVDSNFFPNPVLTGYAHGIRSLHDSMIESRSAAKSLTFVEEPLQKTEYFNRRLQLLASTFKHIVPGDCGNDRYMPWLLTAADLVALAGKNYLEGNVLKRLKDTDRHLIGEVIQLRTIFHCLNPDPEGVCTACFGDLALSIPRNTNVGHVSATALCEQASQAVLSVKHIDSGSDVDSIQLSEHDQRFIRVGADNNTIQLADRLEDKRVILTVSAKEASHISDISYVEDIKTLQVSFISDITQIVLTTIADDKEEKVVLPIAIGSRHGSMSHELLEYLKVNGWDLTSSGDYNIDLSKWNIELPLFVLPLKHTNMLNHMKAIETFLKATRAGKGPKTLKDFETPEAALTDLYVLVSSHLNVNIAHLEVLIKATMIRSWLMKDYRLPHEGNSVEFGAFDYTMRMRSLSAAMAFEKHKKTLNDPATYLVKTRSDHILDPMLIS